MAGSRWRVLGMLKVCLILGVLHSTHACENCTETETIQALLEEILSDERYDRRVRPGADKDEPTVVTVNMFINTISSVSEVNMDYKVNIFYRQQWSDLRLADNRLNETVTLNYNQFHRLWVPDTFFTNEKNAHFHDITVPNRLLALSPNGDILYSQRLTLQLGCSMKLERYPVDNQTCLIQIESYGYTLDEVIVQWRSNEPIQRSTSLRLPEFQLVNTSSGECTQVYTTGSFTCIYGHLSLQRLFHYYLIQTYIPSCLIVILSWVSFWIDKDAVPARITLGLLTVLTMTTQTSGISQSLPRVSYVKAIDVWMSTCLLFVFGALIEYSIVNVLGRKKTPAMRAALDQQYLASQQNNMSSLTEETHVFTSMSVKNNMLSPDGSPSPISTSAMFPVRTRGVHSDADEENHQVDAPKKDCCTTKMGAADTVDLVSRYLFPCVFVGFNIIYWTKYL